MKHYAQAPLGEVCAVNPSARKSGCPNETAVSFVPMAAVDETTGEIAVREERPFAEVAKGYTSFEEGDVLFAKITPCMENGKVALARNLANGMGRGSTEFYVLRPGDQVLGEYIYHFVRQPRFREEAKKSFTGTAGQQRVPKSFIQNIPIPIPPLDDQRRIVAILNRAAKIERLRKQAQQRLRKFIPALFVKMFGNSATNPMGWEIRALGNFCEIQRQSLKPENRDENQLRFVGVENIEPETGRFNFDSKSRVGSQKSATFLFDERHILYGKLRPYLNKVATPNFRGMCSTELVPLLPRRGVVRCYLAQLLRSPETVSHVMASVTGSRMPRADMQALMAMLIPVPPIEIQRRFSELVNQAEFLLARTTTAEGRASAISSTLMSHLLEVYP